MQNTGNTKRCLISKYTFSKGFNHRQISVFSQDLGAQLTEVAARVNDLQSSTQEAPDVTVVFKELVRYFPQDVISVSIIFFVKLTACMFVHFSLRCTFLQKKQVCAESTVNRVREATSQLQQWSHTVQAEPSSHSQVKKRYNLCSLHW